jgi:hypothetical protein
MAFVIPVQEGLTFFTFDIEIDGRLYNWEVYWNEREETWYFDLFDEDQIAIITGVKLVINYNLLSSYADARIPAGAIMFLNENDNVVPTADNLGVDFNIYYFTEEEVNAV